MLNSIIALAVLLMLSAFFSATETAMFSLSNFRLKHLVKKKRKNSLILQKIKKDPHYLLSTILIGNNVVNIAASALATVIASDMFKNNVIGIVTGVMTILILIFGEITPKTLALRHKETFALAVAKIIRFLMIILGPIVKVLDFVTRGLTGGKTIPSKITVTEEELKTMVEVGEESGEIKESEKKMINRIFKFDDIDVSEIMTARPYMVCLSGNTKIKDSIKFFEKTPHTKVPVYEKTKDKIVGVVHLQDVLKYKNKEAPLDKVMRKTYFVPETKKIDSMLRGFQARKSTIAIVVDEHGVVSGLVTMEDVLEEIVGEISDETDKINPNVKKISKSSWKVLGKTDMEELNKIIGSKFKEDEDFETIGGYVLNKLGRIPSQGEEFSDGRYIITVDEADEHKIVSLKIKKK